LESILAEFSGNPPSVVSKKTHLDYFKEYFGPIGVNARTIVVETPYVDRDFLEDFAAYYVKCFQPYERYCSRLHFFSLAFSETEFETLLAGDESALKKDALDEAYLGFVVVKKLPEAFIGRTCLRTYPDDGGRRHYPLRREYRANLFGLDLSVDSLAFQEQDRVVAACATSALWSAFQATGRLFHHKIPCPVEITQSATRRTPSVSRAIPNAGLTILQAAEAIKDLGLEHSKHINELLEDIQDGLQSHVAQ